MYASLACFSLVSCQLEVSLVLPPSLPSFDELHARSSMEAPSDSCHQTYPCQCAGIWTAWEFMQFFKGFFSLCVVISSCEMNVSGSSVCMGFFPDSVFFFLVVRNFFLLWELPARDEDFPLPLCPVLKTPLGTCFLPIPIFQDLRGSWLFLLLLFQVYIYISH